jgi:hypothetical protein
MCAMNHSGRSGWSVRSVLSVFSVASVLSLSSVACSTTEAPTEPSSVVNVAPSRVTSVTVSGVNSFFQQGQTGQLAATVTLSNGFTENRAASAQWQSTNSNVASVSAAGLVTAGQEGEATIRATIEGVTGEYGVRVRYGFRAPDPAPGTRLPLPNEAGFVASLINSRPDLVARSCQDQGGTWELLDFVVDRLREKDLRWGYNGRRADPNFVARDEVAYHYGAGDSLNSRQTYAIDILGGHCGPNPTPAWFDVTDLGTIWLTRGRF